MSKYTRVLASVLEVVSAEADVPVSKIMSRCSEAETVDARWLCVKLLNDEGYYPGRIAELMSITPRYVQYILTEFDDRIFLNKVMRINYANAAKKMRIIGEITI